MKQFSRFLVTISFLTGGILHAQSISGTIVDEYNEPLPSVSISTQDGIATSTNFNGQYTLSLKPGKHVLTYRFIGYQTVNKEVEVKGKMVINLIMKPSLNQLNEVVVVGYGVARKRDLTGSVVSIKSKELTDIPTPSFENAIQGKAAGVQVITGSGIAGSGSMPTIRSTTQQQDQDT